MTRVRPKHVPLPDDIEAAYLALFEPARRARERGDWAEVERLLLRGWELIPEPKVEYDRAQSTVSVLVDHYRDHGNPTEAKRWLPVLETAYGHDDPSFRMSSGTVAFVAGELDDAYRIFDALYRAWGKRPFEGMDPKYLRFYLDRKKPRAKTPR